GRRDHRRPPPDIAAASSAPGRRRSLDPHQAREKQSRAPFRFGEIRPLERRYEPLPLAPSRAHLRHEYLHEFGPGRCGVSLRTGSRPQNAAPARKTPARGRGRSGANHDDASRRAPPGGFSRTAARGGRGPANSPLGPPPESARARRRHLAGHAAPNRLENARRRKLENLTAACSPVDRAILRRRGADTIAGRGTRMGVRSRIALASLGDLATPTFA